MQFTDLIQMFAALAVTLGIFGLGAWALRKYGPYLTRRMQAVRADRRLAVIETLVLDPRSRIVLVRVDDDERLVLIGEGRLLDAPPKRKAGS